MRRSFRFWLIYSVAWLPYAASYMTLFLTHLGRTFFEATKGSIINVLPAALLGVGVVAVSKRLRWSTNRRYKFLTAHLVLASVLRILMDECCAVSQCAGPISPVRHMEL